MMTRSPDPCQIDRLGRRPAERGCRRSSNRKWRSDFRPRPSSNAANPVDQVSRMRACRLRECGRAGWDRLRLRLQRKNRRHCVVRRRAFDAVEHRRHAIAIGSSPRLVIEVDCRGDRCSVDLCKRAGARRRAVYVVSERRVRRRGRAWRPAQIRRLALRDRRWDVDRRDREQ